MTEISYNKSVPVIVKADIVIAGGGPAGVAAAVSSARQGKKTVLIEQSGSLGGAGVLGMVPEFMTFNDGEHFLAGGIGKEIFEKLSMTCHYGREGHTVKSEPLKRVYDEIVTEAGVRVMFYTRLIDVVMEEKRLRYALISCPDGIRAVEGEMFIDCTGSGSLSDFAGAQYDYGDENGNTMSSTICTLWGGVNFDKKQRTDAELYEKAYEKGLFSQYDTVLPGIMRNHPEIGAGYGNVGHIFGVDERNTESLTNAMIYGRKILAEYETYYKEYVKGCEGSELIRSADFLGVRSGRRIRCEYTLTADTFFDQGSFPDEIGRYSYNIDIHPVTSDKKGMEGFQKNISIKHGKGESYSIPLRCLIPKGIDNLFVAGRCIGTDHTMQATTRVIPCCFITGQAAGVAAAVCAEQNTKAKNVDVKQVQDILRSMGAYMKV
ncbi:MAG: FAD-dependent oxidoreductase [Clostridia bacterium]|nr:FAD-dependent oxidoreductase [Clostridia bacterium]